MRTAAVLSRIPHDRIALAAVLMTVSTAASSCGGSAATSVTAPSSLNRCAISMKGIDAPLPAEGGSATIAVTAARECAWSASVEGSWLTIKTGANGQGDGVVEFNAMANPDPQMRRGAINANGQRSEIAQSAGSCQIVLEQSVGNFNQGGGSGQVQVRASSQMCPWTASADAEWIQIRTPSGQGNGTVSFEVAPSTTPTRSSTITIAGQKFSVTQSEGCAYAIAPISATVPSAASTGKVAVTTGPGCSWTATSQAPWLTIASGASGSGNGEVQFAAAATTGPGRNGTMTIAGQIFTVTQGEGCTFTLSSASATVDDAGGEGTFTVQTSGGCSWTASSTMSWLTILSGASGTGQGVVRFSATRNTGPSRSAAITAGGQTFTVTQGNGCSISLASSTFNAAANGGTGSVNVTAGGGCSWTATSNAAWVTITSGANGTSNGTVGFTVAANSGPGRQGTLTIGGQTFRVSQAENCSYAISPGQVSVASASGTTNVTVTSPAGCGWTASSGAAWLSISSGGSGNGNGTVRLAIQENAAGPRSGTATIAGQVFTVNQASGCTYGLSAASQAVGPSGGPITVAVTAPMGCAWTASSQAAWLTIPAGASGNGNGPVQIDVQSNTGPPRNGTVLIAGHQFTVSQDTGCSFVVSPENLPAAAAGGGARIEVSAAASCAWTAASGAGWIGINGAAAGTGNGGVDLAFAANTGPARSGTVNVAGRTVTVTQDGGCTFSLNQTSQTMPSSGGIGTVSVSTSGGCPWSAASGAPWIAITDGASGSGAGNVTFAVEPNATGALRSGTLTIANLVFTLNQQ